MRSVDLVRHVRTTRITCEVERADAALAGFDDFFFYTHGCFQKSTMTMRNRVGVSGQGQREA